MAGAITMQGLIDASLDSDTLGEFANEDKLVTSRLGAEYPSAAMASRLVVENGLLGATPFSTYAAMIASALNNGDYAIVTNDTSENSGIYKKENGYYFKQSYNTANDAVKLVESLIAKNGASLAEFVDSNGKIYMLIDNNGKLRLTGISDDVQTLLSKSQQTAKTLDDTAKISGDNGFALMLIDESDKLIFGVKNDGSLVTNHGKPRSIKRPYYLRIDTNYPSQALQQITAPVPIGQVPTAHDMPNSLLSMTIAQPATHSVIDTIYYKDDGVVHPHILDFYSGVNGSQYWLGITPYHENNNIFENPFIYTSNNLKDFAINNDFAQPIAERPYSTNALAYNSDIFFTYDHQSAELLVCWRSSHNFEGEKYHELWERRTRDGKTWSAPQLIYRSLAGDSILSPSIVYDFTAKKYIMFCVDGVSSGVWGISRMESDSINGTWGNKTWSNFGTSLSPWHLDVRYVGRDLCCLINDNTDTSNLYLGISKDMGKTFMVENALLTGTFDKPYKATMTPIYDGNQIAMQIIWTSNETPTDNTKDWRLYSTKTAFTTITGA